MEKIIFFILVIPILAFVLYLGVLAITIGFKAKEANKNLEEEDIKLTKNNDQLVNELTKLDKLRQNKVLTQEEFDQAKKKILDN
jgi:hypothetical protein